VIKILGMGMPPGWTRWPWAAEFPQDDRCNGGGAGITLEIIFLALFFALLDFWFAFVSIVKIALPFKFALGGKLERSS